MEKRIIAVAGGIGCGKSVVCRILIAMGYPVYDCDSRARCIMDNDAGIIARIAAEVAQEAVGADGRIDRSALSAVVFSDDEALRRLNSIVHAAVRADFRRWAEETPSEVLFVESAILYQSGLDREVGEVWEVCAPMELRLERVMKRNGFTEQQVLARMSAQDSFVAGRVHPRVIRIINDGCEAILPQIEAAL